MTDQILEDDKTPAATGASADTARLGGTKDLTLRGQADGPAGQSGVWVEGETADAGTTDPASVDKPILNPTPSGQT